jgi:thiol:disulfide interchange protein DsbA
MHDRVYVAIHEHKRLLSSRSEQVRWASEQGLNATAFEAALRSDATAIATRQAGDATVAYGIRVTPSLVFDGRYITTGEMIGNASRVPQVLDGLLQMALAARGGNVQ